MRIETGPWLCRLAAAVLLVLVAAPAGSAEPDTDRRPAVPQEAEPPKPAEPERTRQKSPGPASSFTPSEQIGADSAVSFPVDI
ncbi:MAG: hypothetical protein JSU75_08505 [Gammaproteobacteria bacterium]|nr:MAG: hypothetical protein JSU75_08505 [Gammaproteobacteria bacterium]